MKCGKCGTPILPGENFCRICGTKYEANTPVPTVETLEIPTVKPAVETLEVPIVKPAIETLEVPIAKPVVETIETPIAEPVVETLAAPVAEPVMEPVIQPIVEPIMASPIAEPVMGKVEPQVVAPTTDIFSNVVEERPVVTETKENLEDVTKSFELAKELDLSSKVEQTEEVKEPTTEEVKEEKKEKAKKEIKDEDEKSIEEIIAKNNRKPNIAFIITLVLLIISIALNVVQFLTRNDVESDPDVVNEKSKLKTIYYNDYSMNVDYNWIYTEGEEIVFNDKTENWGVSLKVVAADYAAFKANEDKFNDVLAKRTLDMSSKTQKVVNNKTVHVFSGKYNDYITDVAILDLGNDNVVKAQVLYKAERDNVVLDKVLELMTSIKTYDTTLLNDTTFKFESLDEAILENSTTKTVEEKKAE